MKKEGMTTTINDLVRLTPRQSDRARKAVDEKNELITALWDEFRIGKAYLSSLEYLGELSKIYDHPTIEMMVDFLPEQEPDVVFSMPLSGSRYWSEVLDPPGWFKKYLDLSLDDPVVDVLKEAKRLRDKKQKVKYKKDGF
jgi:hypothetical protein